MRRGCHDERVDAAAATSHCCIDAIDDDDVIEMILVGIGIDSCASANGRKRMAMCSGVGIMRGIRYGGRRRMGRQGGGVSAVLLVVAGMRYYRQSL